MSLHRSLLACVAIASALAGCNSSSSVPFDQVDNAVATKICDQLLRCPSPNTQAAQIAYITAHPGTFSCADSFLRSGDFSLTTFQASIDAGRIRYDGAAAAACLSAIDGTCGSFDQVFGSNANCQNVFVGSVANGGTCYVNEDCAGDAYCDNGGGCPGTCKASATVSQACDTTPCSQNYPGAVLRCTSTVANPTPHCVARTATSVGAGENCGVVSMTGDMEVEAFCQSGLYCKRALAAPTGTCAVPVALLQACVPNVDACVSGASCRANGVSGFRCESFTISNTAGTQCNDVDQLCNPLSRLQCVAGSCALVGTGAVDQPCRPSLATDCNAGLYCDDTGVSPVCKSRLANGQPCDPGISEACTSGYCDDVTNPSTPVCGVNLCN